MVLFAREKFPEAKYPNLPFEHIDARELYFNREFDIVFSNAALHWIVGHRLVINGIFLFVTPS